jgi:tetratricopeptide (TPR) repeat protein
VLITSRHVLATLEGGHLLHLDVLTPDQALELLGRIASAERIAADPHAAAEVLRYCGYLPLAIRIAGARLIARPGWAVQDVATRLADATRRLEELRAGELAMRASFDVSLQTLEESRDPVDQAALEAFGLLSLPDGPDLGVAAAARLVDSPEPITHSLLERLVDTQLLDTPRPGRYRFHDLVRLYAREYAKGRHPEPERLPALIRTVEFYTATAWHTFALLRPGDLCKVSADPRSTGGGVELADASTALAWLEDERANLVAAIAQAEGAAPAMPAKLICQFAQALFGFFRVRGYWQDGLQTNQIALRLARSNQDLVAQAHAQKNLGSLYGWQGRYAEAIACQQDSLTVFRQVGDRHGEAASLNNLGVVYERLGRYADAIACHRDSLAIRREMDDRHGAAMSLSNLGIACFQQGRCPEAIACQQDSLAIRRELGDRHGEGYSLSSLGLVHFQQGRYAEAMACQQDSLAIRRELGDRHGEAESLRNLGDALRAVGYDLQAQGAWRRALAICDELQIPEAEKIRERLATLPSQVAEASGSM